LRKYENLEIARDSLRFDWIKLGAREQESEKEKRKMSHRRVHGSPSGQGFPSPTQQGYDKRYNNKRVDLGKDGEGGRRLQFDREAEDNGSKEDYMKRRVYKKSGKRDDFGGYQELDSLANEPGK